MRLNIRRTLQLTSGFLTVGAVAVLSAQQPKTLSSSDGSRPLSQIITQLRKTEGIPICYEDPRYRNSEDLQDVTEPVSRGTTLEKQYGPRIVVPKGHAITFVYSRDSSEQASALSTVKRMLDQYAQLGGPSFTLEQDGTRLFVQPHLVNDAQGNQVQEGSILDALITLPAQRRTGEELLDAICASVAAKSGFHIDVGSNAPSNLLRDYRTEAGFVNQPARQVLAQLLDSLSKRQTYVWDLYYDPSDGDYALNFAYVEKP